MPAVPMTGLMIGSHEDSDYRRFRKYESLLVLAVAIVAALLVGGTTVLTVVRPLHDIARALGPTP